MVVTLLKVPRSTMNCRGKMLATLGRSMVVPTELSSSSGEIWCRGKVNGRQKTIGGARNVTPERERLIQSAFNESCVIPRT
ncbi:3324_t:CDS:1, partial [Acaulospora morrowiae]